MRPLLLRLERRRTLPRRLSLLRHHSHRHLLVRSCARDVVLQVFGPLLRRGGLLLRLRGLVMIGRGDLGRRADFGTLTVVYEYCRGFDVHIFTAHLLVAASAGAASRAIGLASRPVVCPRFSLVLRPGLRGRDILPRGESAHASPSLFVLTITGNWY